MFKGTYEDVCNQAHALISPRDTYFEVEVRTKRSSLMLLQMDDLAKVVHLPTDRDGVLGPVSRLVAVLDEAGERWMHFTTPIDAWKGYVRRLFDYDPTTLKLPAPRPTWRNYEVIWRTNTHSHVIFLRVSKLNSIWKEDERRLRTFFDEVTEGFLQHNQLP